ncbi:MAG: protein kinase domain-containing protein [Aureliella sp.]
MLATSCPPDDEIRAYLNGRLEESDSDVLERHLEECRLCDEVVERLDSELGQAADSVVRLLRHAPPEDEQAAGYGNTRFDSAANNAFASPIRPDCIAGYRLGELVGRGGMGAVYHAHHQALDRSVAIKVLPALAGRREEFVERFLREMKAAGRLEHPSIVRTTDAGEHDGFHYLVMDLIDGLDLSKVGKACGRLRIADACEVVRQAALGLSHAHEQGIVHRDIKPSNLMLDAEGRTRILDFGLAQVGFWDSGAADITSVGQLMGTLDYMAPEQAEQSGSVDYRADLYSLGATLFRLLTGRAPLAASPNMTPLEKLRLLSTFEAPKLDSLRDDVSRELCELIASLLNRDPSKRPASAVHVAEALRPFCDGEALRELLTEARRVPAESSDQLAALLPLGIAGPTSGDAAQTATNASGSNDAASGIRDRVFSAAGWLAFAALACCGVMLILETQKGQLIIESPEAGVHVDVVDDESNQTAFSIDMDSETETTRLRSGKYRIVIDAPSDQFRISNETFEILNGQTVIARVSEKATPTSSAANSNEANSEAGSESVLEAGGQIGLPTYEGADLAEWMRRLRLERSPEEISKALAAISSMAGLEYRSVLRLELEKFASTNRLTSAKLQSEFLLAVHRVCGNETLNCLTNILAASNADSAKALWLSHFNSRVHSGLAIPAPDYLASFKHWARATLSDEKSSEFLVQQTANTLVAICDASGNESVEAVGGWVGKELVQTLATAKRLTNDNFWLQRLERYPGEQWHPDFREEVQTRAFEALGIRSGREGDKSDLVAPLVVLRNTLGERAPLSASHRSILEIWLKAELNNLTEAPASLTEIIDPNVPGSPKSQFEVANSPYDRPARATRRSEYVTNYCHELLLTVEASQLAESLSTPLESLFEHLGQLPIGSWVYSPYPIKTPETVRRHERNRSTLRQLYTRVAYLLRRDSEAVNSRFEQMLNVDVDRQVSLDLQRLFYTGVNAANEFRSAFNQLWEQLHSRHRSEAVPELVRFLSEGSDGLRRRKNERDTYLIYAAQCLYRMAPGEFWSHYVEALDGTDEATKLELMEVQFSRLEEFGCSARAEIQPLLNWVKRLHDTSAEKTGDMDHIKEVRSRSIKLLVDLLRDRSSVVKKFEPKEYQAEAGLVADECQQAIVDTLKGIQTLHDRDFWLLQAATYPIAGSNQVEMDFVLGRSFRDEQSRRAIEVLKLTPDHGGFDESLFCQAIMILRANLGCGDSLGSGEPIVENAVGKVIERCSRDLELARNSFVCPDELYGWEEPAVGPFRFEDRNARDDSEKQVCTVNALTCVLNMAHDLEFVPEALEVLWNEIDAADDFGWEFTSGSRLRARSWMDKLKLREEDRWQVMRCSWYLQAGLILKKDLSYLLNKAQRSAQRRMRFIRSGDTLAIYIPRVLPQGELDPPIIQAGTKPPVMGYPVRVAEDGSVAIPFIGSVPVVGKELKDARETISKALSDGKIINRAALSVISVEFLMRDGEALELRNVVGTTPKPQ